MALEYHIALQCLKGYVDGISVCLGSPLRPLFMHHPPTSSKEEMYLKEEEQKKEQKRLIGMEFDPANLNGNM